MKSDSVIACMRAFVSGDREHAVSIMRQIAADETRSGRNLVADKMKRLVRSADRSGNLVALPSKHPKVVSVYESNREMSSLVLAESVSVAMDSLFREWRHKSVLLENDVPLRQVVLLSGPSGNGKTALAEAVANELKLPVAFANYAEMISSYMGKTGSAVASAFEFAAQNPCVLFFDEADSLCMSRTSEEGAASREQNRTVNQVLTSIDKVSQQSIVFLATNFATQFDSALKRRIKLEVVLDEPTDEQKVALIELKCQQWPFLEMGPVFQLINKCKSFAECEDVIVGVVREHVLASCV